MNPILGKNFVKRVFNVLKFAVKAITALIDEMLRLGHRTRGGIILIMMLFYAAYVMSIVLWVETKGRNESCSSIGSCIFTLARLTFFDGTGFDFAYYLTDSHKGLFCIVMFYMMLTSFGILNGLVGIFGNVFATASDEAFGNTSDEDEEEDQAGKDDEPSAVLSEEPPRGAGSGEWDSGASSGAFHRVRGVDSREVGDHDEFDSLQEREGAAAAKRVLRADSVESFSSDQVMPFTSDMSLRYIPSDRSSERMGFSDPRKVRVVPGATPDSPTKSDAPQEGIAKKGAGTQRKATYEDLKQLLDMRKQTKQGASATRKGQNSNNSSSQQRSQASSAINLFAVAGIQAQHAKTHGRSVRGGGGGGALSGSVSESGGEDRVTVQQELQQLREDMRAMLQMQMALQKQLTALTSAQNFVK